MEKTYTDIRVFRFQHILSLGDFEVRAINPVPIYGDSNRLIGFASVDPINGGAILHCAIDPANPERLDLELQTRSYWMDADLEARGLQRGPDGFRPTIFWVNTLRLTSTEIPGHDEIRVRG